MIRKLLICNYALIERMEIAFEPGLSVITGETGAGKSIILGALSLILGQRADARVVTDASKKTVVEGWFDVSHYDLAPFFEENDIEYDAHECILRRELSPAGKSRAFINDTPVTAAQLKQLGERLIDIHSQHQNVLLSNSRFQLKLVDVLARDEAELEACRKAYVEYRLLVRQLEELQAAQARNREEEDYLRFQWSQLDEARLVEGEEADLQAEQERLSRAEELKAQLYELTSMLDDESSGILPLLNSVLSGSRAIERFFGSEQQVSERIETACIDLKDIDSTLSRWNEDLTVDPARLAEVQARLDLLYTLQRKHRVNSVEELISLRDEYATRLESIEHGDETIEATAKEVKKAASHLQSCAAALTHRREEVAPLLAHRLMEAAIPLGMPHARVEVKLLPKECDETGAEQVSLYFSANKNQALLPVGEVASGGEISRLMLCIKWLMSGELALPTIIFDEIDTGVSGDIAARMGHIMREMSRYMQVIAITHLPQVAAMGDIHYRVYKDSEGDMSRTHLLRLSDDERVEEIARMLSGTHLTDAAIENARALLGARTENND